MTGSSVVAGTRRSSRRAWSRAVVAGTALVLVACSSGSSTSHATTTKRTKRVVTTTTTSTPAMSFTVRAGDTLTSIANFFGVSASYLATYNHLSNGDMLTVGQMLQIPPPQPLKLAIDPPASGAGEMFNFNLTGAKAMENVVFVITDPHGKKFQGAPHVAGDDGSVMATYQTSVDATNGVYVVIATGDRGTMASASFKISANAPIS